MLVSYTVPTPWWEPDSVLFVQNSNNKWHGKLQAVLWGIYLVVYDQDYKYEVL